MNEARGLFESVCSFPNLLLASRKAQKGKRLSLDVARFTLDLEAELFALQRELCERTYSPGQPKVFMVQESKKRVISAMPYRDRVVHHALCNVIEPLLERSFIYDSYANRRGKGTAMEEYLAGIGLRLRDRKTQVFPVAQGVDFPGFKVFPGHRLLRRSNVSRFRRRLRGFGEGLQSGKRTIDSVSRSVRSWVAHASWGDTRGLRRRLFAVP
ncbi:MAG: hypothetical protein HY748_16230 [Elusimicrobia bacterium]|nr:hypothetical protein [Elusimicrobiota bacterium]